MDDAIERDFCDIQHDFYQRTKKGHGRIETRRCWTTGQTDWLRQRHDWPGLQSIAAVDCRRQVGEQVAWNSVTLLAACPDVAETRDNSEGWH